MKGEGGSCIETRKTLPTTKGTRKTPGNHPHEQLKQNSGYSVAIQYQNTDKSNENTTPNPKSNQKTTPNSTPHKTGGGGETPTQSSTSSTDTPTKPP